MPEAQEAVLCESVFSGGKVNEQTAALLERLYDLGNQWGFTGYEPCQAIYRVLKNKQPNVDAALAEKIVRELSADCPTMFMPITDGIDWEEVAGLLGSSYRQCLTETPERLDEARYGGRGSTLSVSIFADGVWHDEEAKPSWGEDGTCHWSDLYQILEHCTRNGYRVQVFGEGEALLFEWQPKKGGAR